MNKKRRETSKQKKSVIVVLAGTKISSSADDHDHDQKEIGLEPLLKVVQVVGSEDDILVLTLLRQMSTRADDRTAETAQSHDEVRPWSVEDHQYLSVYQQDPHIKFLHQEITSRKYVFRQIFKPFYEECKAKGVSFQVKIAAGFRPRDIIVEEANNAKATWIVMDSCFAKDLSFRIDGTDCNVSLVSDDHEEEAMSHTRLLQNDGQEEQQDSIDIEVQRTPKSPRLCDNCSLSVHHEQFYDCPLSFPVLGSECGSCSSTLSNEKNEIVLENITMSDQSCVESNRKAEMCTKVDTSELELPLQLSWEAILRITRRFKSMICTTRDRKCSIYDGYLEDDDQSSLVLVKRIVEDHSCDILEAEKRAALIMNHKNIFGLMGYHKNENVTVLIFPAAERGSLGMYLCGSRNNPHLDWRFQDKMEIALGIALGLRYMHEECPGGPIVHGLLMPCNIFIRYDFRPMISGFGKARRIHLESLGIFRDRSELNLSDEEANGAVKSDILSFGVLLLRLFCRRSIPRDDKILIDWARPFLVQGAFHELLDDDSDLDVHGIYRVMSAATQCTRTTPNSRPCMSEVISMLKGKRFCEMQASPYLDYEI